MQWYPYSAVFSCTCRSVANANIHLIHYNTKSENHTRPLVRASGSVNLNYSPNTNAQSIKGVWYINVLWSLTPPNAGSFSTTYHVFPQASNSYDQRPWLVLTASYVWVSCTHKRVSIYSKPGPITPQILNIKPQSLDYLEELGVLIPLRLSAHHKHQVWHHQRAECLRKRWLVFRCRLELFMRMTLFLRIGPWRRLCMSVRRLDIAMIQRS